jgi:hypothetical protein
MDPRQVHLLGEDGDRLARDRPELLLDIAQDGEQLTPLAKMPLYNRADSGSHVPSLRLC